MKSKIINAADHRNAVSRNSSGGSAALVHTEEWRDVVGFEGRYGVSNMGRVKSLVGVAERILKAHTDPYGYPRLALRLAGKRNCRAVHWLVAAAFIGPRPCGMLIDHIDRNPANNSAANLRYCTLAQNSANSPKAASRLGTTPYKGVGLTRGGDKFRAGIMVNQVQYHLGHYSTPEEAARAYDAKAVEVWGEYALLNFPIQKASAK